jgi:hypothetical protein
MDSSKLSEINFTLYDNTDDVLYNPDPVNITDIMYLYYIQNGNSYILMADQNMQPYAIYTGTLKDIKDAGITDNLFLIHYDGDFIDSDVLSNMHVTSNVNYKPSNYSGGIIYIYMVYFNDNLILLSDYNMQPYAVYTGDLEDVYAANPSANVFLLHNTSGNIQQTTQDIQQSTQDIQQTTQDIQQTTQDIQQNTEQIPEYGINNTYNVYNLYTPDNSYKNNNSADQADVNKNNLYPTGYIDKIVKQNSIDIKSIMDMQDSKLNTSDKNDLHNQQPQDLHGQMNDLVFNSNLQTPYNKISGNNNVYYEAPNYGNLNNSSNKLDELAQHIVDLSEITQMYINNSSAPNQNSNSSNNNYDLLLKIAELEDRYNDLNLQIKDQNYANKLEIQKSKIRAEYEQDLKNEYIEYEKNLKYLKNKYNELENLQKNNQISATPTTSTDNIEKDKDRDTEIKDIKDKIISMQNEDNIRFDNIQLELKNIYENSQQELADAISTINTNSNTLVSSITESLNEIKLKLENNNQIDDNQLDDNQLDDNQLDDNQLDDNQLDDNQLDDNQLDDNQLDDNQLDDNQLDDNQLDDNQLDDNQLDDNQLDDNQLDDNQLNDNQLEDNQLDDNQLDDNQLEDNQLEDNQLEDNQLEDNQLEDNQLDDNQLEDKPFNKMLYLGGFGVAITGIALVVSKYFILNDRKKNKLLIKNLKDMINTEKEEAKKIYDENEKMETEKMIELSILKLNDKDRVHYDKMNKIRKNVAYYDLLNKKDEKMVSNSTKNDLINSYV